METTPVATMGKGGGLRTWSPKSKKLRILEENLKSEQEGVGAYDEKEFRGGYV